MYDTYVNVFMNSRKYTILLYYTTGNKKFPKLGSVNEVNRNEKVVQLDTNSLNKHENERTSDKPFSYSTCDKRFAN